MSQVVAECIPELAAMKKYPTQLFYEGNLSLLKRPKVSIVGTRRPSNYTRQFTYALSKAVIYNNKLYSTIINGTIGDANALQ